MVRSYVRGARRAGAEDNSEALPWASVLRGHPGTQEATVPSSLDELRVQWGAFRVGIEEGVSAVMMGPARFEAVQPVTAGSLSAELIALLRGELEFGGLVMTCDIDHKATIGNRPLGDTTVDALAAGADLVLLSTKAVPPSMKLRYPSWRLFRKRDPSQCGNCSRLQAGRSPTRLIGRTGYSTVQSPRFSER